MNEFNFVHLTHEDYAPSRYLQREKLSNKEDTCPIAGIPQNVEG
jgi:hypothetical protein